MDSDFVVNLPEIRNMYPAMIPRKVKKNYTWVQKCLHRPIIKLAT